MDIIYFKPKNELTFNSVQDERKAMHKIFADSHGEEFGIDLSEVKHCDSAGLALLLDAKKLCIATNKNFELIGLSQEIQWLFEFCGLDVIFTRT